MEARSWARRCRVGTAGCCVAALSYLLLTSAVCTATVRLRLAAGAEVIPLRYEDLESYNSGVGADLRADIVWCAFTATALEMGYREFPAGGGRSYDAFALHRFGLMQRFYPLYFCHPRPAPYVGFGLTASNEDGFSLDIPSADYGGYAVTAGIEIPIGKAFVVDPALRWDYWASTDYFYSGVGLGAHLIWRP